MYNLLCKNAVLLELYRDDIYVDLPNNDKLTSQLDMATVFEYLLNYIEVCFETEQRNISDAIPRISKYYDVIGSEYISSILLEGVVKNMVAYFKNEDEAYEHLNNKAIDLCSIMLKYSKDVGDRYGVYFNIPTYLNEHINR